MSFFNPGDIASAVLMRTMVASMMYYAPGIQRPCWIIDSRAGQASGKTTFAELVCYLYKCTPIKTNVPELNWFQQNGVPYDPETIIQREIYLDGKNICRVNGCLVTVSILHDLGIQLINIHGQHDSASLFDENNHLQFLDDFAANE